MSHRPSPRLTALTRLVAIASLLALSGSPAPLTVDVSARSGYIVASS
jgi:hypothetical protein